MTTLKKSLLLIAAATGTLSTYGQQDTKPAERPVPVRSVFIHPSSPQEGRDPFFPDSLRPYASAVVKHTEEPITALAIKGFSGPADNRMVIINNHSFGVGDEGDVLTTAGRIHVRCLAINTNSVVLEADNQRIQLKFSTQ